MQRTYDVMLRRAIETMLLRGIPSRRRAAISNENLVHEAQNAKNIVVVMRVRPSGINYCRRIDI